MNYKHGDDKRGPAKPRPHGLPCGKRLGDLHFNASVRLSEGAVDGDIHVPPA